jgi:hypothetical protein
MDIREKNAYTIPNTSGGNNLDTMGSDASEIRLAMADPEASKEALPKKENSRLVKFLIQPVFVRFM